MSVNPIEDTTTPKTTGSLEELFRHHLGEEAAVPPRPMLWEQIDNSLLLRQNEQYRRRLVATRWVAAASLLLATLAGTGWWAGRTGLMGAPEMAATSRTTNGRNGAANATGQGSATPAARTATPTTGSPNATGIAAAPQRAGAAAYDVATKGTPTLNGATVAPRRAALALVAPGTVAARRFGSASAVAADRMGRSNQNEVARNATAMKQPPTTSDALLIRTTTTAATPAMATGALAASHAGTAVGLLAAEGATGAALSGVATAGSGALTAVASIPALAMAAPASTLAAAEETVALAAHPAALSLAEVPALPGSLPAGAAPVELAATPHRWRYNASYAVGAFNPNVNFSRAGVESEYAYNPVLGPAELSEAAAAEYRQHLRPGLSQRVALLASRHLHGHWSLGTGAELSKASARSATTVSFVGEQVADGGQSVGQGTLRTTDFSYTMASLPLELRYANTAKRGWSLYGRLGGVVSALLGSRSEVAGRPESTQTYTLTSASTPYRRLTSSVRGAAGARFSAGVGHWAFTLGPVAEVGLVSLNAHPVQNYFAQSHPYSLGLEAGVEFGR